MKVIVSQYGSRRRYLVPRILDEEGLLGCLYTDTYNKSLLGRFLKFLSSIGFNSPSLSRTIRRDPHINEHRIKSYDGLQIKLLFARIFRANSYKIFSIIFEGSAKRFIKWGCKNGDVLYNMFIENLDYVKFAKKNGLKIIVDIYENPYIFKDLVNEIDNCPEYQGVKYLKETYTNFFNLRMKYVDDMLELADKYLIPSQYVAKCLSQSSKFSEEKVAIIPYASSIKNKVYQNTATKGRIIWVGNDPVRKGLVYCERAAKILKKTYPFIDFRIIGAVGTEFANNKDFEDLHFIGHVNKETLEKELQVADMYIFPTLAEGFAGTLLEAASYGVPIITTHASGFGDDFPGIFVNEKDTNEIVKAATSLIENRDKRDKISHSLFDYSQKISENAFREKLLDLLEKLCTQQS